MQTARITAPSAFAAANTAENTTRQIICTDPRIPNIITASIVMIQKPMSVQTAEDISDIQSPLQISKVKATAKTVRIITVTL